MRATHHGVRLLCAHIRAWGRLMDFARVRIHPWPFPHVYEYRIAGLARALSAVNEAEELCPYGTSRRFRKRERLVVANALPDPLALCSPQDNGVSHQDHWGATMHFSGVADSPRRRVGNGRAACWQRTRWGRPRYDGARLCPPYKCVYCGMVFPPLQRFVTDLLLIVVASGFLACEERARHGVRIRK